MYSKIDIKYNIEYWIYFSVSNCTTICKRGGVNLQKFIVKKPEKEVISLRLDSDLLKTIDEKSAIYEISRNELINQMITFALDNMQEETKWPYHIRGTVTFLTKLTLSYVC